jgi:hypothetical protein
MKKPSDVLVIQVATAGLAAIRAATHLENGVDFVGFRGPGEVIDSVYEDKPQLLITGIISGECTGDVAELVTRLREKNRQLVVVTYSSLEIEGDCFDLQINKREPNSGFQMRNAVKDFHEGRLRRKVAKA